LPAVGFHGCFGIADEFPDDIFGIALCVRRNSGSILDRVNRSVVPSRHVVTGGMAHDFHFEFRLVVIPHVL
jgi:hypothetical protein